jgi:trypsin-like peptidase
MKRPRYRGPLERVVLVVLAAVAMFMGSCPASWAGQPSKAEIALVQGTLRLIGRFSSAHACPIEPRVALTNGHVIDMRPFDRDVAPFPYAWSDGTGASGFLVPLELERGRDLARVQPLREGEVFPHPLRVAQLAPEAGDRVWLLGYSWANRKRAMEDDVIEARVMRVVALHLIFVPSGRPGSSGSCLVNDAGEVVAINEGGYETDAKDEAGLAVGVWGVLARMPE